MALFLDRHDSPGLTPEEVAAAHLLDLDVQTKYGVQYHTYWFDPENGSVFCLAEGPDRHAVEAVHEEAHGVVASAIIEVDARAPLNSFMGPAPTHPPGTAYSAPAFRVILFTDICGSVAQTLALGDTGHMRLLHQHDIVVRSQLETHGGREVKHTGDGIMAAFESVTSAVASAIGMQRGFVDRNRQDDTLLQVSIGISAGEPVTDEHDDLFGAVVQLAARLCDAAGPGDIGVSLAVRELARGKSFQFRAGAPVSLKGMPDPTEIFLVSWSDGAA